MPLDLIALPLLVLSLGATANAQTASSPSASPFVLSATDVFAFRESAGRDASYRISVSVPSAYKSSTQRYAVVYVLDGDWYFALAASTARLLEVAGELSPVIIVSIGYGGTIADQRARRGREFTPHPIAGLPGSGEAETFLGVLQKELIPLIESRYRTSDDRTLLGHSLGGLFATFTMARAPELFRRVIIGSPALRTSGPILMKQLTSSSTTKQLPQRIFLGLAAGDVTPIRESHRSLREWLEAAPPSVHWTAEEFANTTHQSVVGALIARALSWSFLTKN